MAADHYLDYWHWLEHLCLSDFVLAAFEEDAYDYDPLFAPTGRTLLRQFSDEVATTTLGLFVPNSTVKLAGLFMPHVVDVRDYTGIAQYYRAWPVDKYARVLCRALVLLIVDHYEYPPAKTEQLVALINEHQVLRKAHAELYPDEPGI